MRFTKPSDHFQAALDLKHIKPQDLPKPSRIDEFSRLYSVRLGNTTLITGYPSSGKSYFILNMQMGLSVAYGWKHLCYTPEMGDPEEITITMSEILLGKRAYQMTDTEFASSLNFLDEHFKIIDVDKTPTMVELCKEVTEANEEMKQRGMCYHTFSIDNLNDLNHGTIAGTQDIYFEQQHVEFNRTAKANKMHGFLSAHPANPKPEDIAEPPSPFKIKGGSAHWSKGQSIISLMRKEDNLTVKIFKIKPRIVGQTGEFQLRIDQNRNTYFMYSPIMNQYFFEQHIPKDPF